MKWGGAKRSQRVGDLLQREIAGLLHKGLKDPRLEDVSITGVDVTADLREAILYFQVRGGDDRIRQVVDGFESAQAFLRGHLGRVLYLRHIPHFTFRYDPTLDRARRIESLLREISETKA
ncbi:MAG: 30S ribosome-binding factor RbfA [Nitrospirae bacterium]|nr:30S ribosome-binding factor RbfA [Nitrospirota bacterium]